jgi:hypothetical protein
MTPFPLDNNYEITDNQEIYSHHLKRILSTNRKTYTKGNEYKKWWCAGTQKEYLLHRTIALVTNKLTIDEFLNKNILINHINGIKTDNRPENLEKVTFSGNLKHYHSIKHTPEYLARHYSLETLKQAITIKEQNI